MHLGEHPSFFDNPKSANCLLYLTCLMVNLLYFLINPSPSHPRVEEFEMAKNYAFSYSPENSCILGDLSLRRHAWACEPIKSRIWSTTRKMTCLYIYIYMIGLVISTRMLSRYLFMFVEVSAICPAPGSSSGCLWLLRSWQRVSRAPRGCSPRSWRKPWPTPMVSWYPMLEADHHGGVEYCLGMGLYWWFQTCFIVNPRKWEDNPSNQQRWL